LSRSLKFPPVCQEEDLREIGEQRSPIFVF